jgi:hypothetical protein
MTTKQVYKISDDVISRIVQIIQEALFTGIDCVDIMRQLELEVSDDDANVLTLPEEYIKRVAEGYERMVEQADELRDDNPFLMID